MLSALRTPSVRCLLMCALFVLASTLTPTPAIADLPSSVASRVTKINNALNAVETALEADRLATAQRKLKEANRYLKEIQGRYAGKFDETDPAYTDMNERLNEITVKVKAAESGAAQAEAQGQQAKAANEALCKQWVARLSPFIDHDSDQYLRIGSNFNSASPEDQAKSKAAFTQAKIVFDEYQNVTFPLGKTMELQGVESRLISSMKHYAHEEADEALEAACKPWVDRLAPYVDAGMGGPKQLIPSATADSQQLARQQSLYEEATLIFAEYEKAEFPLGKSWRLESLEEDMRNTLAEFPEAIAQSQAMMSGDVGSRLDSMLNHLNRDVEWKTDPTKKPRIIMPRDLEPLREAIGRFADTVPANNPDLAELRQRFQTIEVMNAERRTIRAERTFQRIDRFAGQGLKALKKKAKSITDAAYPKAKTFKVTVPSEDWAIEDVVEYTDSTNSAVRHRITRSVRAEVALTDAQGNVWLQEIYLAQDRTPDGDWGPLKGHTTWADPMSPKNLGKEPSPPES